MTEPRTGFELERVVVVGASLAGLRACETLRKLGYARSITLVGAEPHRPYDRPPLSKQLLAGTWEPDRINLRPPDSFDALAIDCRFGVTARALDLDDRAVEFADGTTLPFDGLIVATGSVPRRLPGQGDHPHVHELRTLDDALRLRAAIHARGARVAIVGAGFIGLEVAATARRAGCEVTVLEALPVPLIRGVGELLGPQVAAFHDDEGVAVRCGVTVAGFEPGGVRLGDGELVGADAIVVGIGVVPATGWLEGSGLTLADGVVCDPTLAAGPHGVYAAGDVARWRHAGFDEELRIEHWTNAAEQGAASATNLLVDSAGGDPEAYAAVPFVWSDQYDHRLQLLGRATRADGTPAEPDVVLGSPAERRFLALYRDGDRLRGVLGLNVPRLVMKYRPLLARSASAAEAVALADEQRVALG